MSGPLVLVAATSARALVESARRAGFAARAVDLFGDDDLRAAAEASAVHPGGLACGFRRRRLVPLLDALAADAGRPVAGLVLGSGFEDRPRLVAALAARFPLLGCAPEAIAAVKDPDRLAEACRAADVPHPAVARAVPAGDDPARWMIRRRAGTGGAHVRPAVAAGPVPAGHVAMARVAGTPVSAAVLADGRTARVLAYTRQWADPAPGAPYRFAGVLGPVEPPAPVRAGVERAAAALAARFGLVGLVGLDLLVDGEAWHLLEINPRPGASLDVLDADPAPWTAPAGTTIPADAGAAEAGAAPDPAAAGAAPDPAAGTTIPAAAQSRPSSPSGRGLFAAHVRAAGGVLPPVAVGDATIRATLVVHAPADYPSVPPTRWPDWVLDRPAAGTRIAAGVPLATVAAAAPTPDLAERLLFRRAETLTRFLGGSRP